MRKTQATREHQVDAEPVVPREEAKVTAGSGEECEPDSLEMHASFGPQMRATAVHSFNGKRL